MRSTILFALCLTCLCLTTTLAQDADVRTWTDVTGKHKIQARFVSLDGTAVTLRQPDGTEFEIELEQLSAGDRKHVEDAVAKASSPFKAKPPSPFTPKMKEPPAEEEPAPEADTPRPSYVITPDWSGARSVDPIPESSEWNLAPDPAQDDAPARVRAISLPKKTDFFERQQALVINPRCSRAVVGYTTQRGAEAGSTRVVLCDLAGGRTAGTGAAAGGFVPLALHDDGRRFLVRKDVFGFGNSNEAEIWSIQRNGIQRHIRWMPYEDIQGGGRDIAWGEFIDENRAVTVSGSGKLAVWNIETAEPEYYLETANACRPALSPGRKYLAFTTGEEIGVLDVHQGVVVARQSCEPLLGAVLAFSASGNRLAAVMNDKLYVWDFATGQLFREMLGSSVHVGGHVAFPHDDYLLIGNQYLVNVEHRMSLWQFRGAGLSAGQGSLVWFTAEGTGRNAEGGLVAARLPTPGATEALEKAMQDPDYFILKPGVKVTVDVSGIDDASQRATIEAALTAKLKENGCDVGPGGPLQLKATTAPGERKDITYHTFGRLDRETINVQSHLSTLELFAGVTSIWRNQTVSIPSFFHLQEGESLQQAVRRLEHPNYGFFERVDLPQYLANPEKKSDIGVTVVTAAGVRQGTSCRVMAASIAIKASVVDTREAGRL